MIENGISQKYFQLFTIYTHSIGTLRSVSILSAILFYTVKKIAILFHTSRDLSQQCQSAILVNTSRDLRHGARLKNSYTRL